jgi:uncharacterized membrane protein
MLSDFFNRIPTQILLAFIIILVDIPWLWGSSGWSGQMVRNIQGSAIEFKYWAALIVYVALGYLATIPKSYQEAFLIGFSTYAVYDFTNMAILKDYDLGFAIADTTWGGILFTIVYHLRKYFNL